jgi:hypothetical protein
LYEEQEPLKRDTRQSFVREQRDPVYEYHRVEALKDTPKYKETVALVGEHMMPNPFLAVLERLNVDPTIDNKLVHKIKMQEITDHVNGNETCQYSIPGKACHFYPLAQDVEYVTKLYVESMNDEENNTSTVSL